MSNLFKYLMFLCVCIIFISCNESSSPEKSLILNEKFYAVDSLGIDEFKDIKSNLGEHINLVILQIDGSDVNLWKKAVSEAEKYNLKLILWPLGYGHQWTTWHWKNNEWDISEGLKILEFSENYVKNGGKALEAIVMTHEPFWNNGYPFTTKDIQSLYYKLKEKSPNVKLFNYINNLSEYDKYESTKIKPGIGDILATWWHIWGGAEGGDNESVLKLVDNDLKLIKSKNLDVKLLFAIQCFGWESKFYKMPNVSELKPFCDELLKRSDLDGIIWYSWGKYSYDSSLRTGRIDNQNKDRWEFIRNSKFD